MSNLKIKTKVYIVIITTILTVLALCTLSLLNSDALLDRFDEYQTGNVELLQEITEARIIHDEMASELLNAITSESHATVVAAVEHDAEHMVEYIAILDHLLSMAENENSVSNINTLKSNTSPIESSAEAIEDIAMTGDFDAALDYYNSNYLPLIDADLVLLESMIGNLTAESDTVYASLQTYSTNSMIFLTVVGLVSLVIILIVCIFLMKSILNPIRIVNKASQALAAGDFENAVIDYNSSDEIGALVKDIQSTINVMKDITADLSRKLNNLSNGNFAIDNNTDDLYVGDFKAISTAMHSSVEKMNATLLQVSSVAMQVSLGSEQVASDAQNYAYGASEQAVSVNTLTSSMTEMTSQVIQNSESASKASGAANAAIGAINSCNQNMGDMMLSMKEIESKSAEINKIIKVIEDIAFQTNILALNAAVEAARAGSAGKGFAVVADEVRNLAGKSSEAARNTTSLIESSIEAVSKGVSLANVTANNLSDVVVSTNEAVELINEIADATASQRGSIDAINEGLEKISSIVNSNSAISEQSAAASEELSSQAETLKILVNAFSLNGARTNTIGAGNATPMMSALPQNQQNAIPQSFDNFDKY